MKKQFLLNQAIVNSISAAFQHAGVYEKGLQDTDARKKSLRKSLADQLKSISAGYVKPVSDDAHCASIAKLADDLTQEQKSSDFLRDGRFRIGIAQKALNLYLKYLWCLGDIPVPPHCPIDRGIIDQLDIPKQERKKYDWTKLDKIEDYRHLIGLCCKKAKMGKRESIAEWELAIWRAN